MTEERIRDLWPQLPSDWIPVEDGKLLLQELNREMPRGHKLKGLELVVFAQADYHDDIAVLLPDGQVAEIHLTWNKESDPTWPWVSGPMTFDEWLVCREEDQQWREECNRKPLEDD